MTVVLAIFRALLTGDRYGLDRRRDTEHADRPVPGPRPVIGFGSGITVLGFASLGYAGVWRSFYSLERTAAGLALSYHWPSRRVVVPRDSIERINTAPGYGGQRPLRVIARDGRRSLRPGAGASADECR